MLKTGRHPHQHAATKSVHKVFSFEQILTFQCIQIKLGLLIHNTPENGVKHPGAAHKRNFLSIPNVILKFNRQQSNSRKFNRQPLENYILSAAIIKGSRHRDPADNLNLLLLSES